MKNIIERIKGTVAPLVGGRFVYDSEEELNVILDNEQFPMAFMVLLDQAAAKDTLGRYTEQLTFDMYFAELYDDSLQPIEREDVFDRFKQMAFGQWLPALSKADGIRLVSVNNTRRQDGVKINEYDVTLTAFVVNVTIEDTNSYGRCAY